MTPSAELMTLLVNQTPHLRLWQKEKQQTGAGGNGDSPPSEGQSQGDYQQPMSVASDQPSSYNLSFLRDGELREDDEENNCPAAAADLQCEEETDGPVYVNTAALAAAAVGGDDDDDDNGGDTAGSEYMHVLDYGADEDADNIYLTAPPYNYTLMI